MFNEELFLYRLAKELSLEQSCQLIEINKQENVLWFMVMNNGEKKLIKLCTHKYGWENQFRLDMLNSRAKVKELEKLARTKLDFITIYISAYSPVEDMYHVMSENGEKLEYYSLDENNYFGFIEQLNNKLSLRLKAIDPNMTTNNQAMVEINTIVNDLEKPQKKQTKLGKAIFTYVIIALNIIMFIILELAGGSQVPEVLIQYGAKYNVLIIEGESWRLFTSMFLHVGLIHLLMNMYALYFLGSMVERSFGSKRFLFIYLLGGIGGSLASFAFTTNISAGASGAIFALFGTIIFYGFVNKGFFSSSMGRNVILIIGLNVMIGFTIPQIDNSAHLGGLISGFVLTAIVYPYLQKNMLRTIGFSIIFIVLLISLWNYAFQNKINLEIVTLQNINEYVASENYTMVVEETSHLLNNETNFLAEVLFQRAYAYIQLAEYDLAIDDLKGVIEENNRIPEAYYNLAIVYAETDELDQAKYYLAEAIKLAPERSEFLFLENQLNSIE